MRGFSGVGSKLIVMSRGGTAANHVVFAAEHKWGAKIDGLNNTTATGFEFSANYIDVKDFECYGFSDTCMENYNGGFLERRASSSVSPGTTSTDVGRYCTTTTTGRGWDFHQQRQCDDRREPKSTTSGGGAPGGSTLWRYLAWIQ